MVIVLLLAVSAVPAFAQDAEPRRLDSLSEREREREMQQQQWQGPSGFWTSPHKSKHGAYRYRLMGIGGGLILVTGLLTWRLIKRAKPPKR